jgi:hypothetical protein
VLITVLHIRLFRASPLPCTALKPVGLGLFELDNKKGGGRLRVHPPVCLRDVLLYCIGRCVMLAFTTS